MAELEFGILLARIRGGDFRLPDTPATRAAMRTLAGTAKEAADCGHLLSLAATAENLAPGLRRLMANRAARALRLSRAERQAEAVLMRALDGLPADPPPRRRKGAG